MRTTIDIPEELLRELKLRAAASDSRLKDVLTEVISLGLAGGEVSGGGMTGEPSAAIYQASIARIPTEAVPASLGAELDAFDSYWSAEQSEDFDLVMSDAAFNRVDAEDWK